MILEAIIVAMIPIYFLSWITGGIEGILFAKFLRSNYPDVAAVHYPGILKGSIPQQLKTTAWLWKRQYIEIGDTSLARRADGHRKITLIVLCLMVTSGIVLIVGGQRVFSDPKHGTEEAEQVMDSNPH